MAAGSGSIDALSQFKLTTALGPVGASVNFTQANGMMLLAGALTLGLLVVGMRPRAMVPGRLQALAELSYTGVMSMCVETIGPEGRRFFPFIFTLFAFILVCAGIMILRVKRPELHRAFKVSMVWVVAPLGIIVCGAMIYGLGWTKP